MNLLEYITSKPKLAVVLPALDDAQRETLRRADDTYPAFLGTVKALDEARARCRNYALFVGEIAGMIEGLRAAMNREPRPTPASVAPVIAQTIERLHAMGLFPPDGRPPN
jgi:hypothetical protein